MHLGCCTWRRDECTWGDVCLVSAIERPRAFCTTRDMSEIKHRRAHFAANTAASVCVCNLFPSCKINDGNDKLGCTGENLTDSNNPCSLRQVCRQAGRESAGRGSGRQRSPCEPRDRDGSGQDSRCVEPDVGEDRPPQLLETQPAAGTPARFSSGWSVSGFTRTHIGSFHGHSGRLSCSPALGLARSRGQINWFSNVRTTGGTADPLSR